MQVGGEIPEVASGVDATGDRCLEAPNVTLAIREREDVAARVDVSTPPWSCATCGLGACGELAATEPAVMARALRRPTTRLVDVLKVRDRCGMCVCPKRWTTPVSVRRVFLVEHFVLLPSEWAAVAAPSEWIANELA